MHCVRSGTKRSLVWLRFFGKYAVLLISKEGKNFEITMCKKSRKPLILLGNRWNCGFFNTADNGSRTRLSSLGS